MPFRVSVKEMYKFQEHINLKKKEDIKIGYAMRDDKKISPDDSIRLMTVGYWLEQFVINLDTSINQKPSFIMIDEAHDASWQTDLALRLVLWQINKGAPIKLIISSATLDIASTIKTLGKEPVILSIEEENKNLKIEYVESKDFLELKNGKFSEEFYNQLSETVYKHIKRLKDIF